MSNVKIRKMHKLCDEKIENMPVNLDIAWSTIAIMLEVSFRVGTKA